MLTQDQLVVQSDPRSASSESFRILKTNLEFVSGDEAPKSILVTSSSVDEGKSIVAANLAIVQAQAGKKVILVGCDLRRPALHNLFGLNNSQGLTSVLLGNTTLEKAIQPTNISNLEVLVAGQAPVNPGAILESKVMKDVLQSLVEQADLVIIDAAPVVGTADAAVLVRQVDGVVFVVAANKVPKDAVVHAKDLLDKSRARLLGVVLNGVSSVTMDKYEATSRKWWKVW